MTLAHARPLRPLVPADILRQVVLEEHDLSPDGRFAVVVRRFVLRNAYGSNLWVVPLRGDPSSTKGIRAGRPFRLTDGAVRDRMPRISPDGRILGFRRRPADASSEYQLSILRLTPEGRASGRIRTLTKGDFPVEELAWSPDSSRVAFTRDADPPRFIVGEERDDDSPLARRIRRTDWRYDGDGFVDRWRQLFVTDVGAGARARQLTVIDFGRLRAGLGSRWRVDHLYGRPQAGCRPPATNLYLARGGARR